MGIYLADQFNVIAPFDKVGVIGYQAACSMRFFSSPIDQIPRNDIIN